MAIIVQTEAGYEKIESGYQAHVTNGTLLIQRNGGAVVAAYAEGEWKSAVTEGDRTDVDENGEALS